MDINHSYWEENSNIQHLKYESCNSNDGESSRLKDEPLYRCCDSNLNFATVACSEDDSEFSQYKKNKVSRQDPMSHRIIEKRRRDRMNNCLADLSRLIPAEYLKKGRGRIEKTEIIEMAIRHIKYLQHSHRNNGRENSDRNHGREQYRLGYQECMSETMRFLVEVEGYFAREALCVRLINHLQKHCENLIVRERVNNDTKIQMENEYSQLQIPTVQINGINSTPIQPIATSPMRQTQESYGNVSQLRDMLTNNLVKDDVRMLLSPQVMQPSSPRNISEEAPTNLTRLPSSPGIDRQHYSSEREQYKIAAEEHAKNSQELNNISKERERTISENDNYSNGVSLYKFKNNIKQRFSQDLNAESNQNNKFYMKRRKVVDLTRRNSVTTETYSSENHSSPMDGSQCSPPSSELYRISSESENARISPTGSSVSDNRQNYHCSHIKVENNSQKNSNSYDRYSPTNTKQNSVSQSDMKKPNFSVPIFALHAKGSFYVPLTIDYQTLLPYLQHNNMLDMLPNLHNIILHPVTINVNFQSNYFSNNKSTIVKSNKHKMDGQNGWH